LRAAVFTPLLYFGSFSMIIYNYEEHDYMAMASFITSCLALICCVILRFVGDENNEAVSHFLIYFVFMPFGLGCTSKEFNFVPIIVSLIVTLWAYGHIKKHTSAAVFLVSVIPFIVLVSVANLVTAGDTHTSKMVARGMLAMVAGVWGIKLIVVYYIMKTTGTLQKTIQENAASTAAPPPTGTAALNSGFNFSQSFSETLKYVNRLGNGCLEQFSACGALWLLASFVFLDGYPALAFSGAITFFLMIQLYMHSMKWWVLIMICATAVTVAAFLIDIGSGLIWNNGYGAAAIVSFASFPLPWIITTFTAKDNYITLSLAPFIALVLTIPFGFTGSYATHGALSVISVFMVTIWTSTSPFFASLGCALLPNFAIVAGAMLRHGGRDEMLMGDEYGSVLPGGSLALVGLYFVIYGALMSKKQSIMMMQLQEEGGVGAGGAPAKPFYLEWFPEGFMQSCGSFALLLGLCYTISGMIGVIAMFLLTIFVGGASFLEKRSSSANFKEAVAVEKHQFAQLSIFLLLLATSMAVAYGEGCIHGVMPNNIAAIAAISVAGFVLVAIATFADKEVKAVPWHVRDFLMYLWFVVGGLIGANATKGSLGVAVIVIGALYSFYRRHALVCVLVAPSFMFWAGTSLNHATGNEYPCMAIGLPVFIYALCELIAAQILKFTKKDVLLKGPGSIPPSWANPKELVPRYFSSALEISGALFLIAGSMGLMYCPGDKGGQLGVGGQLGFIILLVVMGIYLLRQGLILRDEVDEAATSVVVGVIGAKAQGLRLRIAGLLLINAAIWFAFPLTSSLALKAVVIVLGSMVLIISGCASMYWKKDVDTETAAQQAAARNETRDAATAL
jgi:hypothetical protein